MAENTLLNWIEWAIIGVETLAVIIIVVAIVTATSHYINRRFFRHEAGGLYQQYRRGVANAILVGLEILIAADVIRTVALDRTTESIIVLGLLVLLRVILSWSLLVEIDHRWPWQARDKADQENEGGEE